MSWQWWMPTIRNIYKPTEVSPEFFNEMDRLATALAPDISTVFQDALSLVPIGSHSLSPYIFNWLSDKYLFAQKLAFFGPEYSYISSHDFAQNYKTNSIYAGVGLLANWPSFLPYPTNEEKQFEYPSIPNGPIDALRMLEKSERVHFGHQKYIQIAKEIRGKHNWHWRASHWTWLTYADEIYPFLIGPTPN